MHKSPDYNEIQGKSPHYSYVSPQKGLLYSEQASQAKPDNWLEGEETELWLIFPSKIVYKVHLATPDS